MARQKVEDNLFYVIFQRTPTWATAAIVVASYPVLRYLLPALTHGSLWTLIGSALAPWFTAALALIALYAEGDKYKRRRLLKEQSSLETLRGLTWQEFELFVGEVYRRGGYHVEQKGGRNPDGGVDLVLYSDTGRLLVQCKHWKVYQVGVKPVRELFGVMVSEGAIGAILVTGGGFTQEAQSWAVGKPLFLVDGNQFIAQANQAQAGQPLPLLEAVQNAR